MSTPLWIPEIEGYEFSGWFNGGDSTKPVGDKNGVVTEHDRTEIFGENDDDVILILYGNFTSSI